MIILILGCVLLASLIVVGGLLVWALSATFSLFASLT